MRSEGAGYEGGCAEHEKRKRRARGTEMRSARREGAGDGGGCAEHEKRNAEPAERKSERERKCRTYEAETQNT